MAHSLIAANFPRAFNMTIDMRKNNLHGRLLSELGLLSNVQYLGLAGNKISGLISSELGRLTRLEALHLGKFATISSSELDTIRLLASFLRFISYMVL